MDEILVSREVDARGLNCPLPLLSANSALSRLRSGEVLQIAVTDAGAERQFMRFAAHAGHELLRIDSSPPEYLIYIRKG